MTIRTSIGQVVHSWFHGYANMWCDTEEEKELVDDLERGVLAQLVRGGVLADIPEGKTMVLPAQQPILTVNGLRELLGVITKPVEWEYRTFEVASSLRENELLAHVNHHAMEGWEPVSVWPSRLIKTGSQIQQWDTETIDILMRRRHPETDEKGGE